MSTSAVIPNSQGLLFCKPLPTTSSKHRTRLKFNRPRKPIFTVSASGNLSNRGGGGFSWERLGQSIRVGSERLLTKISEAVKKETGIDFEDAGKRIAEFSSQVGEGVNKLDGEFRRFRFESVPEFIKWNKWDHWKDVRSWDSKRIGVLVLYLMAVMLSCGKIYRALEAPRIAHEKKELTEAYMEALIPEPTPANVRKLKKGMWRKTMPKGLKLKKFIEGPDGTLFQDSSYVGEDAWDNDVELTSENVKQIVGVDINSSQGEEKRLDGGLSVSAQDHKQFGTWRERLAAWKEILEKEQLSEQVDLSNAKYLVEFDMKEVENSLHKDLLGKSSDTSGTRALWISKRWWRHRPKLPYLYFLQKLDSSEVAAVVFTEDLKQVYVTMKEGFPLEYIVDIPLDPYLFETISNSGVEVDLLQKRQIHYFFRVVIVLLPGIFFLLLLKAAMELLLLTSRTVVRNTFNQFLDATDYENFVMPSGRGSVKKMYREVIMGGEVWDVLDEMRIYLKNPMLYYEKGAQFIRGVLLSGPPGTGKTHFARTMANEVGYAFVYASGAELTGSDKNGITKLRELFALARRHAPAFIFVDEVDAIAGSRSKKDSRRLAAFNELIAQLDGLKEKTGVDRCSLDQAIIFICATNRPDDLDEEFLAPGRIDRRVAIDLPTAKQRVKIFGVHSAGKQLDKDVDFGKIVFRTAGYSGADIKSLVNEAGILSVRKGHPNICQQDIIDVLDKQLLEGMGVLLTEEEQRQCEKYVSLEKKKLLAVHEAGHILLAHLFPTFDWHAFSQLLPAGKETAVSVFYPRDEMIELGYTTFGYMMMQMIVAHGGRCAEKVVFGDDITDGGSEDLRKITRIAREMVLSRRNTRLGVASLTRRYNNKRRRVREEYNAGDLIEYEWDDPQVFHVEMTHELSEFFTRELTRYIEDSEELAMKGVIMNRHILDVIAKELLEKSRLTGREVEEIMKEVSPIMFEDFAPPFQVNLDDDEPLHPNEKLRYQPLDLYPAPLHRC